MKKILAVIAVILPVAVILPAAGISAQASAVAGTAQHRLALPPQPVSCLGAVDESTRHSGEIVTCLTANDRAVTSTASTPTPQASVGTIGSGTGGGGFSPMIPQCAPDPSLTGVYLNRTEICVLSVFALLEILNGKEVGKATWNYAQQITLSATSLQWKEHDIATLESVSGVAVSNSLGWATNCAGNCNPASAQLWPVTPMTEGQTVQGTATFSALINVGSDGFLTETPRVTVVDPAGVPASISFNLYAAPDVRCDNALAVSTTAGCIVPDYTPTLRISPSTYGAAAAMIQYAQNNMSAHWGLRGSGQPLLYLADSVDADGNRRIICNSTFVNGSTGVADDSCDEYPFASTYESGALNGVTSGAQCAQVTAVQTATSGTTAQQWASISVISSTGTEQCIRGHIPLSLNQGVGGVLGSLVKANRLIDNDPFWLSTSPFF